MAEESNRESEFFWATREPYALTNVRGHPTSSDPFSRSKLPTELSIGARIHHTTDPDLLISTLSKSLLHHGACLYCFEEALTPVLIRTKSF
jgi:hypothetical protein